MILCMHYLRYELKEFLGMYGGHIGYTAFADFVGWGVVTSMLVFGA